MDLKNAKGMFLVLGGIIIMIAAIPGVFGFEISGGIRYVVGVVGLAIVCFEFSLTESTS